MLPHHIIDRIKYAHPPMGNKLPNFLLWSLSANGLFTTKSIYDCICLPVPHDHHKLLRVIWHWPSLERICLFLWKVFCNILPINSLRNTRCMTTNDKCPTCLSYMESLLHALRDCQAIQVIWQSILNNVYPPNFWNMNIHGWLRDNLSRKSMVRYDNWSQRFVVIINTIWYCRNERVFNNNILSPVDVV